MRIDVATHHTAGEECDALFDIGQADVYTCI